VTDVFPVLDVAETDGVDADPSESKVILAYRLVRMSRLSGDLSAGARLSSRLAFSC
jgi:hypothetical protein